MKIRALFASFVLLLGLAVSATAQTTITSTTLSVAANADTNPVGVARLIFADHVFALEIVGTLLVTAAVGALVLTHRQRLTRRVGQKERSDARVARIADGAILTPLPAPGVYARSNAMDTPALGPDGTPLEASVPRVLRVRGQERAVDEVHADVDLLGPPPGIAPGATPGRPQRSITGTEEGR